MGNDSSGDQFRPVSGPCLTLNTLLLYQVLANEYKEKRQVRPDSSL